MKYAAKNEELRNEVIEEFKRQLPTKHDYINLFDKDDEDGRDNVVIVNIMHKHYLYSSAYVLRLARVKDSIVFVCENTENGNFSEHDISCFTTSEICDVLDDLISKI